MNRTPHPLNVPGPFYVEHDCCLCCGVPEHYAPDLFASIMHHEQCFVKRQPHTPDELDRMVEVLETQELNCVRYRGNDQLVRLRLVRAGLRDLIDQ
jgi:hypothetical protein